MNDIEKWIENDVTVKLEKPKIIINLENATGLGDTINTTASIRELKKQNPDKDIIIMTNHFDVYKNNPNVKYVLPARNIQIKYRTNIDTYLYLNWSFNEHHQYDHIVAPYFKNILGDYGMKKYDYSMEMFSNIESKAKILNDLYDLKKLNKPLIGLSASKTMKNRFLPKEYWQNIVNILKDKYTILNFGSNNDMELENVIDLRGKYKINEIPFFLDELDHVIALNSGFLNIAACTKKVHIIHLNVGEFPRYLFDPVRNGELSWNCDTIEHDCPIKQKCFEGHITESILSKQLQKNIEKYKNQYSPELIKKFTVWHYCAKEKFNDKYICSYLIYNKFLKYVEEKL